MTDEKVPEDVRYTKSHEWVRLTGEIATIGITDHAQSELTDIVFVDPAAQGKTVARGASVLVLESVKTVADVYAPAAGTVTEVNPELKAHPELVNQDPYGRGWIFKLKLSEPLPADAVIDAAGYRAFVASGG